MTPLVERNAFLRELGDLHQKELLNYTLSIFDQNHQLTETAKSLFLFTETEVEDINTVMDELRKRVNWIERETATTRFDSEKNELTIEIAPFPERGGKLYDEAAATLQHLLGPERGLVFLEVGRFEEQFSQFGIGVRKITVSRYGSTDGETIYRLSEERRIRPDGSSSGSDAIQYRQTNASSKTVQNRAALLEALSSFSAEHLPQDF